MPSTHCIVLTATENQSAAHHLATSIVTARLAACVQMHAIQSVYRWKGEVCAAAETLLIIKTQTELYAKLEQHIREHHTYETPEIVQIPIASGSPSYLDWITQSTQHSLTPD